MYKSQSDKTNNQPLSNNLFTELQSDILTGRIKSGEKLTEQHICNKYGVSRTPVREALRQLEMDGLIENIPNRGAFVVGLADQDIIDLFDLRTVYEIQAVRWGIERINDDELAQLEETFEFMEFYTMKDDFAKMLNINTSFHELIYASSHNRMLERVLQSYQLYLKHIRKPPEDPSAYLVQVLEEHRAIYEAFKAKDVEAGAAAMAAHMHTSRERFCIKPR